MPGERYELEIPLKAMSYVFAAGHCIRVAIAGADIQNAWPVAPAAVHTVYTGPDCPTRIELPGHPALVELPPADPVVLKALTEHSATHDLVEGTVRLGHEDEGRGSTFRPHSASTVSGADPARAVMRAGAIFSLRRPGREVTVEATETTTSDATAFVHEIAIEITLNGEPYFNKNWSVSVPQTLN